MSNIVRLPEDRYRLDAFSAFRALPAFSLGNARAMVWMAQIANETDADKIDRILHNWGFALGARLTATIGHLVRLTGPFGVVASSSDACVVAFVTSDPLCAAHWRADIAHRLSKRNIYRGFEWTIDALWPKLTEEIAACMRNRQKLFFTGHSMGGALAIIAAYRARVELNATATAVYTFGGVRPGGEDFASRYPLGAITYRLVYGDDALAAWPPLGMGYRHVGKLLHCSRGQTFAEASFAPIGEDKAEFVSTLMRGAKSWIGAEVGSPGLWLRGGPIERMLRRIPFIADHVPDRYIQVLDRAE
jgi:triacylglycerol lipase